MRIVAGLSLKNLKPRVWDPDEPYYLPDLVGVMLSYAEFHRMQARRSAATRGSGGRRSVGHRALAAFGRAA